MTALFLVVGVLLVIQSAAKYLNKNESTTQTLRSALGDNSPTWVVISYLELPFGFKY